MNHTKGVRLQKSLGLLLLLMAPLSQAVENTQAHPLFVYQAPIPAQNTPEAYGQSVQLAWSSLSEFFQAHGAMSIPQPSLAQADRQAWNTALFEQLKAANIPLIPTIADGATQRYATVESVETWLKTYPSIQALHVKRPQLNSVTVHGELASPKKDPQTAWLIAIIKTATRHQRKLIIELDGLNPHILMSHPQYKVLYDTIAKNSDSITVLYRQGGAQTIPGHSALMGLWLEGAIQQWGLSFDADMYAQAGFREPGLFGSDAQPAITPAALYRALILNGAMTGATTYWFNNADELWAGTTPRFWTQVISPTLLNITRDGYIAGKDLVKRNALVAYRLKPASTWAEFTPILDDIDGIFHEGRLIHAAYGMERPGQVPEWIPNNGAYYWIPMLSAHASEDVIFSFKEVLMPGVMPSVQAWRELLNSYYTPDGEGTAFIKKVGRAFFVMHTRENAYESQRYSLNTLPAPLHDISATREGSKITVNWPFREGDVSYSIYRLRSPNLDDIRAKDFEKIASEIDARFYVDETIPPGETVLYSVTALTNERGTLKGTLNYGDYLVISSVTSRIDGFAYLEPYTMRSRPVNGIPAQVSGLPDSQPNWIAPPEDQTELVAASEAIAQTLDDFSAAVQTENAQALLALIHEDYSDSAGTTKALLATLFEALFTHYQMGPMGHQIQAWDTGEAQAENTPDESSDPTSTFLDSFELQETTPQSPPPTELIETTAYLRITALANEPALVPHPIQTIPATGETLFEITWQKNAQQQWTLLEISPPLLQVGDLLK